MSNEIKAQYDDLKNVIDAKRVALFETHAIDLNDAHDASLQSDFYSSVGDMIMAKQFQDIVIQKRSAFEIEIQKINKVSSGLFYAGENNLYLENHYNVLVLLAELIA